MTDRTLIVVKPDCVRRGLTGEVLARFERKGLKLVALRMLQMDMRRRRSSIPCMPTSRSSGNWCSS